MQIGPKQETFCRLVAGGMQYAAAYVEAGYTAKSPNVARSGGSQLARKFKQRIEDLRREKDETVVRQLNEAVATVGNIDADVISRTGRARIAAERRLKLLEIVAARAAEPAHQAVPGGSTGYVAIGWKQVGGEKVRTHSADHALVELIMAHEERIARELGQWIEKIDETTRIKSFADLPDDVLQELAKQAEEVAQKEGIPLPEPATIQ